MMFIFRYEALVNILLELKYRKYGGVKSEHTPVTQ